MLPSLDTLIFILFISAVPITTLSVSAVILLQLELKLDNPPDGPSLTDLVATLLGNVFKTLLKKAEYFDPVGKTRVSRSMVRRQSRILLH